MDLAAPHSRFRFELPDQGVPGRAVDAAGIAAVLGVALAARQLADPWIGDGYPFVTILPALAAVSWWRGARTGVPALAAGWLLAMLLFVPHDNPVFPETARDWMASGLYLASASFIVALGERQARAGARALRGERNSALLAAIVASSDDAIVSKTLDGVITSWNGAAERMFGYTPEEAVGRHITLIIPPERTSEEARIIEQVRNNQTVEHFETERVAKDGRRVNISLTVSPVRGSDGRIIGASKIARDIGAHLAAQAAIRSSEERFGVMADTAPVLVWIAGEDGRFTWFNQPWLEFTGRTREQELHDGWRDGVHPDDMARVAAAISGAVASGGRMSIEFRLRRADGEHRWLLVHGVPLRGDARFSGIIGSCVDIHERKRAEEERDQLLASERAARSEAERLSRLKDEFVATLSHELRTPLNSILGWSQLLRRSGTGEADLSEGLEVIERNARAQSQMIEDLLDVSRIVSGKLRLDVQRVNLLGVVEQAIASARPAAMAKNIRLTPVLDPRTNLVNGDPTRLQQIVWNLLSNAIKFTPKGGRVEVVLRRVGSSIEVSVSDTGKGIRKEFLGEVFQRFRQEDASTTRRFGGLGLGLAIVKQLTELHGGTVAVASEGEGLGATFVVSLPLAAVHQPARAAEVHPAAPSASPLPRENEDLKRVRVLVVDDEADSRDLIVRVLRDCGASVSAAESADQGLEVFRSQRPEVVLSDIGMPDRDGYDFIRSIRALRPEEGSTTPAAALTALARSEDRTQALLAGFQVHVSKPIEPSELIAVVASLARLSVRDGGAL